MAKLVIGTKTKLSILKYAPQAAMASAPKVLMLACTSTLAKPMTEYCTPVGRPYLTIWRSMSLWKRTPRKDT